MNSCSFFPSTYVFIGIIPFFNQYHDRTIHDLDLKILLSLRQQEHTQIPHPIPLPSYVKF